MEVETDFLFLGSKITVDGEIKRQLLLGRKAITTLDSVLKSCYHHASKGSIVKTVVFPVVMYRCESWTVKNAEH